MTLLGQPALILLDLLLCGALASVDHASLIERLKPWVGLRLQHWPGLVPAL